MIIAAVVIDIVIDGNVLTVQNLHVKNHCNQMSTIIINETLL